MVQMASRVVGGWLDMKTSYSTQNELRSGLSERLPSAYLRTARVGKAKWGILLWLLGVPIPVILLIFLVRGCM